MILKLSEIPKRFCCIYKLNFPNGKCYIGQSQDLKRRMYEHNNHNKAISPCDLAIAKYGKISEVEILEEIEDINIIDEREIFWIAYYDAMNRENGYNLTKGGKSLRGEDSSKAQYTNDEVLFIRKLKFEGKRKKDVYREYFSDRNFRGFEGIWWGKSYTDVGKEYVKKFENMTWDDWKAYSSFINGGENSGRAKLTKEDVLEIRRRYDQGERPYEILVDYPFVTFSTINRVCKRETWKNV